MCGIVGYIGSQTAAPILLDALKRLEYRGYDSAGIATIFKKLHVKKDKGKIDEINRKLNFANLPGNIGMAHTRWATHGRPSRENAHPHLDSSGKVAVVHNGIIENYLELKKFLRKHGCRFASETDTEIIPNLIAYFMRQGKGLEQSVREATKRLKGSYALAVLCTEEPNTIIAVRKESPLILGYVPGGVFGEITEIFLASDIPAVLPYTKNVIVLEDGDIAVISLLKLAQKRGAWPLELIPALWLRIKNINTGEDVERKPIKVTWTAEMAEKQGYPHFTLKEINEQPEAIRETLRAAPAELEKLAKLVSRANRLCFVACGTSHHAALVGKYALAKLANVSAEAVISSEFQESSRVDKKTAVIAITQSGETADTLKAIRIAKSAGAKIACLTNVTGSSVTRESDVVCCTHAGPEVSVVATKTFAAQVSYLLYFAIYLAMKKGKLSKKKANELISKLQTTPDLTKAILVSINPLAKKIAKRYRDVQHIYLISRGIGYPTVLEGALKLKEITYIHSEAMPAGELKHGTLALIDKGTPVIAVVPPGESRARMVSNIEEVKARGAVVIAVAEEGDEVKEHVDEFIPIPPTEELFSPLVYIPPLQLLAYFATVERKQDPDRPRSLAKSVTVE